MITSPSGGYQLPCNFSGYIRAQAKPGDDRRFIAVEVAPGPLQADVAGWLADGGCAVFEWVGNGWKLVCATGPEKGWKLLSFVCLRDGRLLLDTAARELVNGRRRVWQYTIAT